ncbi:integumentary mucin C.1-like [Scleropages formosus]|uniref:integumentary mucin C.1-like n=1 Tax=Scleropages formosus TaxID=113540 RepID=UPI000877FA05|nr:integumentary mucin C.1-like [Scleropages formosus]
MDSLTRLTVLLLFLWTVEGQNETTMQEPSRTTLELTTTTQEPTTPELTMTTPEPTTTTPEPTTTTPQLTTTTQTPVAPNTTILEPIMTTQGPATATQVPSQTTQATGRCSADPPLCCLRQNNICNRGCFCDVACLRFRDCCSDFNSTCVTGFPSGTSQSQNQTSMNNMTSVNNTGSTFPIFSFSGSCASPGAMCCAGTNLSCFQGCFCDEACVNIGDCCPDYSSTCLARPVQSVFANLLVSVNAPSYVTDSYVQATLQNATAQLQLYLQSTYSKFSSLSIIKIRLKT